MSGLSDAERERGTYSRAFLQRVFPESEVERIVAARVAAAEQRITELAETLECCREQRADLLELVEIERGSLTALRASVQAEIDSAYQVGANYVPCSLLRRALARPTDEAAPECRWSSARGRWETVIRPGVSKEACGHHHMTRGLTDVPGTRGMARTQESVTLL